MNIHTLDHDPCLGTMGAAKYFYGETTKAVFQCKCINSCAEHVNLTILSQLVKIIIMLIT